MRKPIYAFDFDGVLAEFNGWKGIQHTGKPIPGMVDRVKALLAAGNRVIVFTARLTPGTDFGTVDPVEAKKVIEEWCQNHIGQTLEVTSTKGGFDILFDDIAVQVDRNTGKTIQEEIADMIKEAIEDSQSDGEYYCTSMLQSLLRKVNVYQC